MCRMLQKSDFFVNYIQLEDSMFENWQINIASKLDGQHNVVFFCSSFNFQFLFQFSFQVEFHIQFIVYY